LCGRHQQHALEVALLGLGVGEGVRSSSPITFASASAVACVNAVPVLVDVDPNTFCFDPDAVVSAITPRTRAIVAVHLAGHPADLDRLTAICSRYGLALIEDCAHAHGSSWSGTPVGGFGAAGTWSFQQSKLMTAGEGGAITIQEPEPAASIRSYTDCGRRPGQWFYSHFALGGNYRMTEWQGAMLLAQLERFPEQHRVRNENALYLNAELSKLPGVFPQARDQRTTAQGYYCYVVRIDEAQFGVGRDAIKNALEAEGIPMTASYPTVHTLDAFEAANGFAAPSRPAAGALSGLDLPVASNTAATTLDEASAADGFAPRRGVSGRSAFEDTRALARIAWPMTEPIRIEERSVSDVLAGIGRYTICTNDPPWSSVAARVAPPTRVIEVKSMELGHLESLIAEEPDSETVVGLGGGSAIDTAKFIAWKTGKRLIQIPSITSVDAGFTDAIGVRSKGASALSAACCLNTWCSTSIWFARRRSE
jgi:dTDP-4-amino-4,6-dideoxygalactose transaminase